MIALRLTLLLALGSVFATTDGESGPAPVALSRLLVSDGTSFHVVEPASCEVLLTVNSTAEFSVEASVGARHGVAMSYDGNVTYFVDSGFSLDKEGETHVHPPSVVSVAVGGYPSHATLSPSKIMVHYDATGDVHIYDTAAISPSYVPEVMPGDPSHGFAFAVDDGKHGTYLQTVQVERAIVEGEEWAATGLVAKMVNGDVISGQTRFDCPVTHGYGQGSSEEHGVMYATCCDKHVLVAAWEGDHFHAHKYPYPGEGRFWELVSNPNVDFVFGILSQTVEPYASLSVWKLDLHEGVYSKLDAPVGLAASTSPDGEWMMALADGGEVYLVNGSENMMTAKLKLPIDTKAVEYGWSIAASDSATWYISDPGAGKVHTLQVNEDGTSITVAKTCSAGVSPAELAVFHINN